MRIVCDMDGVLANFVQGAIDWIGLDLTHDEATKWRFYELCETPTGFDFHRWLENTPSAFWATLQPYDDAEAILDTCHRYGYFLTIVSHSLTTNSDDGKRHWLKAKTNRFIYKCFSRNKSERVKFADAETVLIDDCPENCEAFAKAGGYAILWTKPWNKGSEILQKRVFRASSVKSLDTVLSAIDERISAKGWEVPLDEPVGVTVNEDTDPTRVGNPFCVVEDLYTDPETGGQKGEKPIRIDLFAPDAVDALGRVYDFGAAKYEPHNYRKGYPFSKSLAALQRHLWDWIKGEDNDQESGHSHLAHVAWHCFTLIQNQVDHGDRFDDRYRAPDEAAAEVADKATADVVNPVSLPILWEHDCNDKCIPLGPFSDDTGKYDLYWCPTGGVGRPTVVARYGSEGHQYVSGLYLVGLYDSLREAVDRARLLGLDVGCTT